MDALIFNIQKFSLHDGSRIRTSVFFQGCNLRCAWCANPESQEIPTADGVKVKSYSVESLVKELIKDKPFYDASGGGITLTGGEPLLQNEFVIALCVSLREKGIAVALETAACTAPDIFRAVLENLDECYVDLKHWDDKAHRHGTGAGNALALENIAAALKSGVHTVVRIPVIPGYNDSPGDREGYIRTLVKLGANEVHLLPFHQMGENKYRSMGLKYAFGGVPQLREEDLEPFASGLSAAGISVQIGG